MNLVLFWYDVIIILVLWYLEEKVLTGLFRDLKELKVFTDILLGFLCCGTHFSFPNSVKAFESILSVQQVTRLNEL